MQENEVIIVNGLPEHTYRQIVEKAIGYALISIPFTFNRITLDRLEQRIMNIAKGKTAEYIFRFFCLKNNVPADFETCATPFYKSDKRDFILAGAEWDIKNNFIYHKRDGLTEDQRYTSLPALVPCSYAGDQWDKRAHVCFENSGELRFLFTFLKNADEKGKQKSFFELLLTAEQKNFLTNLYRQYEGNRSPKEEPFTEASFLQQLNFTTTNFHLHHHPHLVITAWAGKDHWHLFKESGEGPRTYSEGLLKTRINNRVAMVQELPSFLSLFPHLKQDLCMAQLR